MKILRLNQVIEMTGLSRSSIYRHGPPRRRVGPNAVGWLVGSSQTSWNGCSPVPSLRKFRLMWAEDLGSHRAQKNTSAGPGAGLPYSWIRISSPRLLGGGVFCWQLGHSGAEQHGGRDTRSGRELEDDEKTWRSKSTLKKAVIRSIDFGILRKPFLSDSVAFARGAKGAAKKKCTQLTCQAIHGPAET